MLREKVMKNLREHPSIVNRNNWPFLVPPKLGGACGEGVPRLREASVYSLRKLTASYHQEGLRPTETASTFKAKQCTT